MNPIRKLRQYYNLTSDEFARKIGVSPQTIWNLEGGLYTKPPPALYRGLSLSPEDSTRLELDYLSWVLEQRTLQSKILPYLKLDWDRIESFEDFALAVGGSIRGFCRTITIQTSIVQQYIKSGYRWNELSIALSQCGLSSAVVEALSEFPRFTQTYPDQAKHRSDNNWQVRTGDGVYPGTASQSR